MKWCDFVAQDNEDVELINHLSSCSRLCEGEYRCPYCMRPEHFMDPELPVRPHKHLRRQFFKHAFDAICRLGSKRLRKAIHPSRTGTVRERLSKKRRHGEDEYVPELPTRDMSFQNELDSIPVKPQLRAPAQPKPRNIIPRQAVAELSTTRTRYFEMEGAIPGVQLAEQDFSESGSVPRAELPETRFSYLSTEGNTRDDQTLESPVSAISPVSSDSWFNTENFDSPISPANAASYNPWATLEQTRLTSLSDRTDRTAVVSADYCIDPQGESPQTMAGIWAPSHIGFAARNYPKIRVDTTCGSAKPVSGHGSPSSGDGSKRHHYRAPHSFDQIPNSPQIEAETRSPVKLVEELRGLFNNFFKVTCAKLCQPPMSAAASSIFRSYPSAAHLFETGLGALRKTIQGALPNTIWEIFSIAHLAYTCALANQESDLVESFPEIYKDLIHWSDAIVHEQQRTEYLQLVRQLFDPSSHCLEIGPMDKGKGPDNGLYSSTIIGSDFSFSMPSTSAQWTTDVLPYRSMGQLETLGHEFINNNNTLLHSLRNGITIRLCLQYIGGMYDCINSNVCVTKGEQAFEYFSANTSNINELFHSPLERAGNSPRPSARTARTSYLLRKNVIDQLMVIRGVESFRFVIDNAAVILSTTPHTTLREMELYLIQEGKVRLMTLYSRSLCRHTNLHRLMQDLSQCIAGS